MSIANKNIAVLRGRIYAASYGFRPDASAAVNAAAIMACHNMTGTRGGRIVLPRYDGAFQVAPDTIAFTQRNITLEGDSNAMGYEDSLGGTLLQFTTGNYGISLQHADARHACIENIAFDGNDVLQRAIWANGVFILRGIHVKRCTVAGIDLYDLINTARLEHFSAFDNEIGLLIGSASGGLNTSLSCGHFAIRQNVTGVRILNARGAHFSNGTIESNTDHGVEVFKLSGVLLNDIDFYKVHFEENQYTGGAGYQILVSGTTPGTDRPSRIVFDRCPMTATLPTKAVHVESGEYVEINNPGEMTTGTEITFAAGARYCEVNKLPVGITVTVTDNGTGNVAHGNHARGTFVGTLTGIAGADPTYAIPYTVDDEDVVHLTWPSMGGTSDATTKTLTGMPAELRPATGFTDTVIVADAGAVTHGRFVVNDTGVIEFFTSAAAAAFTASGTTTIVSKPISYKRAA